MPIQLSCEGCGKVYRLDDRYGGRRAKCKACGHPMDIPAVAAAAQVAADLPPIPPAIPAGPTRPTRSAGGAGPSADLPPIPAVAAASPPGGPRKSSRSSRPTPAADDADGGLPSFRELAELERTGKPNQFSNMPPPVLEVAKQPWFAGKGGTSIASADPKVAAEYKKKMSRRNLMIGAGGGIGVGVFGFSWFILKLVWKTDRTVRRNRSREEEADAEEAAEMDGEVDEQKARLEEIRAKNQRDPQ